MKCPISEFPRRIRLDRAYLDRMRPQMHGCPVCGETDSLKVDFDPETNLSVYCNYRIVCTNCGYKPKKWHETVYDAVAAFGEL